MSIRQALADEFHIARIDRPDLPVFLAAAWPRAEGVTGDHPRLPAGRGLTLQQAMISAGAEAIELRASLARNHASDIRVIGGTAMTEGNDLASGDRVPVPAGQIYLDCGHDGAATSTGCATAATYEEACFKGLLECIERDAVALWWHGGMRRPSLPLDLIDPAQPRLFWWLQRRARRTGLIDITQDNGVPAVAAFSAGSGGGGIAVGSAADLRVEDAALAAVTEMIQIEASMALAAEANDPELMRWYDFATIGGLLQFQPGEAGPLPPPVSGTGAILRSLAYGGHRACAVRLTLDRDPLVTVKVMVSGFCALGGRLDAGRFARVTGRSGAPVTIFPEPY